MTAAVRPVGDRGALVELDDNQAVHVFARHLRERYADRLIDVVPGHRTVLLTWRSPIPDDDLTLAAQEAAAQGAGATGPPAASTAEPITIPVTYDGPDLSVVAQLTGMSPESVAARHQAALYSVAFVGFAPGFAYLIGGDPLLRVKRRERPRTRVPAGALALAGEYTAIYPAQSPGGWQLIGSATVRMFDQSRTPPALLEPGAAVRFQAT